MKFNKWTLDLAALGVISLASALRVPDDEEELLPSDPIDRKKQDRPSQHPTQRLPGDVGLMIEQASSTHGTTRAVRHTPDEVWCGIGFTHPVERRT